MASWSPRPTGHMLLSLLFQSEAPYNESGFKSERVDQLLLDTLAETDATKRKEMFCEIQTIVSNEAGNVIPWHQAIVDGVASNIRGMPRVALNSLSGGEWPEFIWLDS